MHRVTGEHDNLHEILTECGTNQYRLQEKAKIKYNFHLIHFTSGTCTAHPCHLLNNVRWISKPSDFDHVQLVLFHDYDVRGHRDEPQESAQNVKPQNVEYFIWDIA